MELEEEFGKKLFIRGNRKITLTDEGILLRKRAEEIVELVEKTETEITASDEIINGDIYIGGGETDAMRIIAHIVKKLQEKYPQVKYHLFSGNADGFWSCNRTCKYSEVRLSKTSSNRYMGSIDEKRQSIGTKYSNKTKRFT